MANAINGVLGMKKTSNLEADERPKAWRLGIMDEYPDAAPLSNVITRVGKEKVSDPEFPWYERRFATREMVYQSGAGASATAGYSDTGITVDTSEAYNVKIGSLVINTTTLEVILVTSEDANGTTFTATRGIGGSGVQTDWASGQVLQVIGSAYAEGADVGNSITTTPVKKYNYTQIFRNVADLSRTLSKTLLRSGDKKKDSQMQALLFHELDKEWAFLMGKKSEDTSASPGPRRTTDGLRSVISTNTKNFASAGLNLADWNTFLKGIFTNGSDEKLLLCGADALLALEDMARSYSYNWADIGKQDSFGMTMKSWITSFGRLVIKEHKLLSKSATFKTWGFVTDPDKLVYRYVDDTEWYPNRQGNGQDRFIGEYLAEVGLEIHEEYCHGLFTGMSTFTG